MCIRDRLIGIAAVVGFVGLASTGMFLFLKSVGWLRVSVEHEMVGLDLGEHALPAYNDDYVEYDEELFAADDIEDLFSDEFSA